MRRTAQRQNLRDSGNDGKAAGAGTLNGARRDGDRDENKSKSKSKN